MPVKDDCKMARIRKYPGCYEDCDFGDRSTCPHHEPQVGKEQTQQASKGGLVPVPPKSRSDVKMGNLEAWRQGFRSGAKAQRTHDLAEFRKVVEDVKAANPYRDTRKALVDRVCDDILAKLKGEA